MPNFSSHFVAALAAGSSASGWRPGRATRGCFLALAITSFAAFGGCAHDFIPNTDVDDTGENRRIVLFCEKYRRAVEERDIETLVSLASPRYFETGGNAKPTDDIDFGGLRAYLATKFKLTKAIRYEIRYRKISEEGNRTIDVDFTYTASFQIPTSEGDAWHRSVRDNRLQLLRDGESFKILTGM